MESLLKHYIGVFDPASGNLKIVEARKMVVRGVVRARMAADEAMAERTVREVGTLYLGVAKLIFANPFA